MTVCKFWRQGSCRFGDKCRFEHPPNQGGSQSNQNQDQSHQNRNQNQGQNNNYRAPNPPQSQNRYSALQGGPGGYNSGGGNNQSGYNSGGGNNNQSGYNGQRNQQGRGPPPRDSRGDSRDPRGTINTRDPKQTYGITKQTIEDDMRIERPQWIMSSYGPGKDAPVQLFGGIPLEQSFEEIRVQHYLALATGNAPQQSAQLELELATQSNQQVQNVLNDLEGAITYIVNGINTHPNRIDIVAEVAKNAPRGSAGVFLRSNARALPSQQSAFQSSSSQQQGFGGPSINQVPPNTSSGFGQPSNLGQNVPFGAPSGFGTPAAAPGFGSVQPQQTTSAFGQLPQQQANISAFGGNSTSQGGGVFGRPQQQPEPVSNNGFGQGVPPQQNSGFGMPQQQTVAFGQQPPPTQHPIQNPPFGAPQTNGTPFGQSAPSMNGGFGAQPPQSDPTPFGQAQPLINNAFGAPSQSAAPPTNGFQTQLTQPTQPNGFQAQPQTNGFQNHPQPNGFQAEPQTNGFQNHPQPNGFQAQPHPNNSQPQHQPHASQTTPQQSPSLPPPADISTYTTRDPQNRLLTWKSRPVTYINSQPCYRLPDGSWERIWFPDGPPAQSQSQMQHRALEEYPAGMVEVYQFLSGSGTFLGGVMPEVAPRVEMSRWDI